MSRSYDVPTGRLAGTSTDACMIEHLSRPCVSLQATCEASGTWDKDAAICRCLGGKTGRYCQYGKQRPRLAETTLYPLPVPIPICDVSLKLPYFFFFFSFADACVGTPSLFVGRFAADGSNSIVDPTGGRTWLILAAKVMFTATDGDELFFSDWDGYSVHGYSFNTLVESKVIGPLSSHTQALALDTALQRVFVWVRSVGIKSCTYQGDDVKDIVGGVVDASDGMAVDEKHK